MYCTRYICTYTCSKRLHVVLFVLCTICPSTKILLFVLRTVLTVLVFYRLYKKKEIFGVVFVSFFFVSSLCIAFGASTMVRLVCYCAFDALIVNDVNVPPHASPSFTSLIFNEQLPGTQ